MRDAIAVMGCALFACVATAPLIGRQTKPGQATPPTPPLVYVCPMPADAAVVEDKPGKCPVCGMTLVPTRIDSKWWCPTHQTLIVRDGSGKCPLDGKALVQVTLSEHWTCADNPEKPLLDPGRCANGETRKIVYELRAHGDHNPRHDGQFFMATDQWHHLEGTYPSAGLFRAYFYDNFTKPIPVKGVSGSLVVLDQSDKELGSFPLAVGRDALTLEAKIPSALSSLPLKAAAKVRFDTKMPEQRFDFNFSAYSKDASPDRPTSRVTTGTTLTTRTSPPAKPAAPVASAAKVPTRSTVAPPTPRKAVSTPPTASAPAAARTPVAQAPLILDSPLSIPPALADALDESQLSSDTRQLVAVLTSREKEVEALVNDGSLAQVWLPAMGTKTVALVLDQRASTSPERQRRLVGEAVKRIVVATWELDNYGDLGDREKISDAYHRLAGAVNDLKALYETR